MVIRYWKLMKINQYEKNMNCYQVLKTYFEHDVLNMV